MATRSSIIVKLADNKYRGVYCHFDGYPSYVGRILSENYNDQDAAEALVNLGDLSQLNPSLNPTGPHSYENPEKGVTVAYGRDRGDGDGVRPTDGSSVYEILLSLSQSYNYLFQDGKWYLYRSSEWLIPLENFVDENGDWHDLSVWD